MKAARYPRYSLNIYSAQLARLAKTLGVSADYLLGFTDERAMSKSKGAEEQTHGR